jgi:hypothetical protein
MNASFVQLAHGIIAPHARPSFIQQKGLKDVDGRAGQSYGDDPDGTPDH